MLHRVSVATVHVHTGQAGIIRDRVDAPPQADGAHDPREPVAEAVEGIADRAAPI
jgi:hypothetical protein